MTTLTAPNGSGNTTMGDDVLVDPSWLEQHLHDPHVRLVEVDVSPSAYDEWHIEGAVLWNIYRDLKDADYQLVDKAAVERLLARSGITADSTVVFYGYGPAIGVWLMKLYGHVDARLLNCSRDAWRADGRPWVTQPSAPATASYPLPNEDRRIRARHWQVHHAIDSTSTIADVRSIEEYDGERFWPSGGMEEGGRAGHVPSAVHVPLDDLRDENGAFRSAAELQDVLAPIGMSGRATDVITYCTIGARACTAWFVLTCLLGRDGVRVYDGSWAEWGRMQATPVVEPALT
jgi:thiosulfate/3-mercaptopyruvate sulfurtransferase